MKQLFFCYVLLAIFAVTPVLAQQTIYSIQLTTLESPELDDYFHLKKYGFLHLQSEDDGQKMVLLGTYTSKSKAESVLSELQEIGFPSAFLKTIPLDSRAIVYVVQLGSYSTKGGLHFNKYQEFKDLRVKASPESVKLYSGIFSDKNSAQNHRNKIAKKGHSCFVVPINKDLLLPLTKLNFHSDEFLANRENGTINKSIYDSEEYRRLSPAERGKVMVLDNQFAIEYKGKIIPLSAYWQDKLTTGKINASEVIVKASTKPNFEIEPSVANKASVKEKDQSLSSTNTAVRSMAPTTDKPAAKTIASANNSATSKPITSSKPIKKTTSNPVAKTAASANNTSTSKPTTSSKPIEKTASAPVAKTAASANNTTASKPATSSRPIEKTASNSVAKTTTSTNNNPRPNASRPVSSTKPPQVEISSRVQSRSTAQRTLPPGLTAKGVNQKNDYRIQVTAVKYMDPLSFSPLDPLGTFSVEKDSKGLTRVILGKYYDLEYASKVLKVVQESGFENAFLVIYENGFRTKRVQ